ncbi:MAG: helix-turn-helix domain-containing protein, partial [Sulfolobales archaeon]
SCRPYGSSGASVLLKIRGSIDRDLLDRAGYKIVSSLSVDRETNIYLIKGRNCPCGRAGIYKIHIIGIKSISRDTVELTGFFGDLREFKRVLRDMKRNKIEVESWSYRLARKRDFITYKQWIAIETALRSGFFEYPRKITIGGLASLMGVTKASASELIKKSLRKILEKSFTGSTDSL